MKTNVCPLLVSAVVLDLAAHGLAAPVAKDVTVSQSGSDVVIAYSLSETAAVVTFDVETNCPATGAWASIGGENLWSVSPESDAFRKVSGKDSYRIVWRPSTGLCAADFAAKTARAVVTAWSLDNRPDYMVVDLTASATNGSERYYASTNELPGGLLENKIYRQSLLVMKKVVAKGVRWTMGCLAEEGQNHNSNAERAHPVALTNDYYLGIFPMTRVQSASIGYDAQCFINSDDYGMRPADRVCYNYLFTASKDADAAFMWPNAPSESSPLGRLRKRTGLALTLPSEAEWEFACRAGTGERKWNTGAAYTNSTTDANLPGRYKMNGGYVDNGSGTLVTPNTGSDPSVGTAIVGSYAPSRWGFYDMHGNIYEWCLDWGEYDITGYGGRPNIDPEHPLQTLSGATVTGRIVRGGSFAWPSANARSACRNWINPTASGSDIGSPNLTGYRLCCPAD